MSVLSYTVKGKMENIVQQCIRFSRIPRALDSCFASQCAPIAYTLIPERW
uniref:Uncharacterized protein n=2 Tax=Rhodnius prolixus TaxID=13249 RepID=T1I414_RHOPR